MYEFSVWLRTGSNPADIILFRILEIYLILGFGLSLCYVAAIIVVAYYFDRRRSFATGISVCGSGVGKLELI